MSALDHLINKFNGREVRLDSYSGYQRWALDFFHNTDLIVNPNIGITLQIDISVIESRFLQESSGTASSFTAYLTYRFFRAIQEWRELRFRYLQGKWYEFDSIPLFFPINVPEPERFRNVLIESASSMSWDQFLKCYQLSVSRAKQSSWFENQIDPMIYEIAVFIGNLPHLRFTSLTPNQRTLGTGSPFLYFGQRYRLEKKLFMPLYFGGHHATFDPVVLQHLLSRVLDESRA